MGVSGAGPHKVEAYNTTISKAQIAVKTKKKHHHSVVRELRARYNIEH